MHQTVFYVIYINYTFTSDIKESLRNVLPTPSQQTCNHVSFSKTIDQLHHLHVKCIILPQPQVLFTPDPVFLSLAQKMLQVGRGLATPALNRSSKNVAKVG